MTDDTEPNKQPLRPAEGDARATNVFHAFGSDLSEEYFEGVFDDLRQKDLSREVDFDDGVWQEATAMKDVCVTLWRPIGVEELRLIEGTGMRAFPPRLPEQPIFYPVLTEAYATKIARDWNAPRGGGYVTRFEVRTDFLARYEVMDAAGRDHQEYWIPAEDLPAFNDAIVGKIEVVASFP